MTTGAAPVLARTRAELASALAGPRGRRSTVALVPTMGALHRAHRVLIEAACAAAEVTVVSVFVNPLQFGPGEDLDRYPRDLPADLELAARAGAGVVFAPSQQHMYTAGGPQVRVCAGPLGAKLEGASRPGHFDGVLTVVLKLLGLVRPDVAVFGEKDAQQLALVRRMVHDLELAVRVVAVRTVREDNGLAASTRNRYLDREGLAAATALSRALRAAGAASAGGPAAVLAAAHAVLAAEPALALDYCALVDASSFEPITDDAGPGPDQDGLLLVAGQVAGTRLIDNARIQLPAVPR
jgi:pantoate--beta-alanine ligase